MNCEGLSKSVNHYKDRPLLMLPNPKPQEESSIHCLTNLYYQGLSVFPSSFHSHPYTLSLTHTTSSMALSSNVLVTLPIFKHNHSDLLTMHNIPSDLLHSSPWSASKDASKAKLERILLHSNASQDSPHSS